MAPRGLSMVLAMVVLTIMMSSQSLAQQNCTSTIASLAPCLGFITGNSSSSPSSPCCTQVASLIQTQTQCLCTVLNGAPQLPFVVNQTRVLTLPGACKIQTTPLSPCNAAASGQLPPTAAPAPASQATPSVAIAPSPTLSSAPPTANPSTQVAPSNDSPVNPSSPAPQAASSGNGSKTVPTTSQTSSAKISTNYAPSLLFLLLAASAIAAF